MKITLKALRVNAGLTRKEVSKALGISERTLLEWEKPNKVKGIRIEHIIKMCEMYGCSVDDIADFSCDKG